MKRVLSDTLKSWKDDLRRKPLLLRGARQVGKTWLLLELGATSFGGRVRVVDLEKRPRFRTVFDADLDVRRILAELELLLGDRIVPGEDLLVLDEIQTCPRAITALRYFHEDLPRLHVAAAGSLLEFAMGALSFPVGRIQSLTVRPLSFAEFLDALGKHGLAELVRGRPGPVAPAVHGELLQALRTYASVGGLPESVRAYVDTGSIVESRTVLADLVATYRDDFDKYAPRADKLGMDSVLRGAATGVGTQVKYSRLAHAVSGPTVRRDLELLELAQLLHRVRATSTPRLPLAAGVSAKRFKLALLDIGMMQELAGVDSGSIIEETDLLGVYQGALAEQFVAQESLAAGRSELYYWARERTGSSAEVDFLVPGRGIVRPIEVKAGAAGRLRSLHMLLQCFPDARPGYVLSGRPYEELPEQGLIFAPIYFAGALARG